MARADRQADATLGIALDRDADVPLGVQLAWALRARVTDGTLASGARLPGLRELAEAVGVNANTVRAVYRRLEQEGLIATQHGSGTFVAPAPRRGPAVADIAAEAAREAHKTGVDPRDVAAALYMQSAPAERPAEAEASRRRELRVQIAALEQALGELQAKYPKLVAAVAAPQRRGEARLLGVDELEGERDRLVRQLVAAQGALDTAASGEDEEPPGSDTAPAPARAPRKRPATRVAPAGA
jgi:DNA-binding transcriptional regulator YhcF (GntR family)